MFQRIKMSYTNKQNVILDLDETLLHSVSSEEMKELSDKQIDSIYNFKTHNMDDYYTVIERPGLQEFLDYLFENYNVSIWTAASKDYALFVVNQMILKRKNRKLDWIMFSYHCDISKKEKRGSKDLEMLWDVYQMEGYSKSNTIIIDDHPDVYDLQKDNCIYIRPFDIDEKTFTNDKILHKILKTMKKTKTLNECVKECNSYM